MRERRFSMASLNRKPELTGIQRADCFETPGDNRMEEREPTMSRVERKRSMATKKTTTKTKIKFNTDDFVVYPTHGVGRILGTEKNIVADDNVEMLVVRFEQDRMTLRVPLEKAKSLGLRTLSSRKQMDEAITTLKGKARVSRDMWSKRARAYDDKIRSGDPVSIAEVVRDLRKKKTQAEQSYSERQMYQAALDRLAREFAAIEKIDQEAAAIKLEELMDAAA